jgi:ABC-2 type transport system permease protein
MAVYKRTYKGYSGGLTPTWSRFMILPRYSQARLFKSKFLLLFNIACFIFPLGCIAYIYVAHNLGFLRALGAGQATNALKIDGDFFATYCGFQGAMAYLMTAFVGPGLVSPDLTNNALPLYLCRPFSRTEYVIGRMSGLLYVLSMITWLPGLVLFGIQWSLAGWGWARDNWWIAGALFVGLTIWMLVLSLIALAMSAWVKWKVAAGTLIIAIFFVGAGFGAAINAVIKTKYGSLLNLTQVIATIWAKLFRLPITTGIELWDAWMELIGVCVISMYLLTRKVRAFEVVK